MASTNSCKSTSMCQENLWCSIIPDATLRFKKKRKKKKCVSDSAVHLSPAPLHSRCFKGSVPLKHNEEHWSLLISPQQSGQWLRQGRREWRIYCVYCLVQGGHEWLLTSSHWTDREGTGKDCKWSGEGQERKNGCTKVEHKKLAKGSPTFSHALHTHTWQPHTEHQILSVCKPEAGDRMGWHDVKLKAKVSNVMCVDYIDN